MHACPSGPTWQYLERRNQSLDRVSGGAHSPSACGDQCASVTVLVGVGIAVVLVAVIVVIGAVVARRRSCGGYAVLRPTKNDDAGTDR